MTSSLSTSYSVEASTKLASSMSPVAGSLARSVTKTVPNTLCKEDSDYIPEKQLMCNKCVITRQGTHLYLWWRVAPPPRRCPRSSSSCVLHFPSPRSPPGSWQPTRRHWAADGRMQSPQIHFSSCFEGKLSTWAISCRLYWVSSWINSNTTEKWSEAHIKHLIFVTAKGRVLYPWIAILASRTRPASSRECSSGARGQLSSRNLEF